MKDGDLNWGLTQVGRTHALYELGRQAKATFPCVVHLMV
jgi:hypothetical protein